MTDRKNLLLMNLSIIAAHAPWDAPGPGRLAGDGGVGLRAWVRGTRRRWSALAVQ